LSCASDGWDGPTNHPLEADSEERKLGEGFIL
jgi:hypothetical protein